MRRGPLYMVLAGLCFTAMVGLVKVARVEMDTLDVLVWRSATAVPLALALAGPAMLRVVNRQLLALRVGIGFVSMFCFHQAAKGLTMADLTLISKLQPLEIAVLAPLFLGRAEAARRRVWLMMGLGLVGCAVLLGPQLAVGSTWGLWAVAASMASALAHITLRALGATDDPRVVVAWFQAGTAVLALGLLVGLTGALPAVPGAHLWLPLVGIGVLATAGQVLMTRAYAADRAAVVAGASYVSPLWAVIGDALFFAALPGSNVVLGGVLVVAAGLGLLWLRDAPEAQAHPDALGPAVAPVTAGRSREG